VERYAVVFNAFYRRGALLSFSVQPLDQVAQALNLDPNPDCHKPQHYLDQPWDDQQDLNDLNDPNPMLHSEFATGAYGQYCQQQARQDMKKNGVNAWEALQVRLRDPRDNLPTSLTAGVWPIDADPENPETGAGAGASASSVEAPMFNSGVLPNRQGQGPGRQQGITPTVKDLEEATRWVKLGSLLPQRVRNMTKKKGEDPDQHLKAVKIEVQRWLNQTQLVDAYRYEFQALGFLDQNPDYQHRFNQQHAQWLANGSNAATKPVPPPCLEIVQICNSDLLPRGYQLKGFWTVNQLLESWNSQRGAKATKASKRKSSASAAASSSSGSSKRQRRNRTPRTNPVQTVQDDLQKTALLTLFQTLDHQQQQELLVDAFQGLPNLELQEAVYRQIRSTVRQLRPVQKEEEQPVQEPVEPAIESIVQEPQEPPAGLSVADQPQRPQEPVQASVVEPVEPRIDELDLNWVPVPVQADQPDQPDQPGPGPVVDLNDLQGMLAAMDSGMSLLENPAPVPLEPPSSPLLAPLDPVEPDDHLDLNDPVVDYEDAADDADEPDPALGAGQQDGVDLNGGNDEPEDPADPADDVPMTLVDDPVVDPAEPGLGVDEPVEEPVEDQPDQPEASEQKEPGLGVADDVPMTLADPVDPADPGLADQEPGLSVDAKASSPTTTTARTTTTRQTRSRSAKGQSGSTRQSPRKRQRRRR